MSEVIKIYLSRWTHWFYGIIGLLALSYSISTGSLFKYWYVAILILILSPFIEYYAHKYFLHLPRPKHKEKHPLYSKFLDHIHYNHHLDPKDVKFVFAQFWLTFPVFILDISVFYALSWSIDITLVAMTFFIAYYLLYEWTHFLAHSNYAPKNGYSKYMKKYHLWHHYKNEHYWYGITSPIADMVFGAFRDPKSTDKSLTVKTLTTPLTINDEM